MLKTRVITALLLLPLVLFALFRLPEQGWSVFVMLICLIGSWEWSRFIGYAGVRSIAYVAVTAALGTPLVLFGLPANAELSLALLSLAFWLLAAPMWLHAKWKLAEMRSAPLLGWLILFASWHAMVAWHGKPNGAWLLLALMAVCWVADTAAYFAGRKFGKRKLAPSISPGKSWEGVMGAYVGITCYALLIIQSPIATTFGGWALLPAVWILTALSIVGDLLESLFKRQAGLKDSSNLLPGHGGILDRIDSQLAILPVSVAILTLCRYF